MVRPMPATSLPISIVSAIQKIQSLASAAAMPPLALSARQRCITPTKAVRIAARAF